MKPNQTALERMQAEKAAETDLTKEARELKRLLQDERRKTEDYLHRLQYLQADMDNYRKRMDRQVRELEEFSTGGLSKKLLPVLDELDLAATSSKAAGEKKSIIEGVAMVAKNLRVILEAEGVIKIEAVGKRFDPELHEAVERVQGKENEDDMVIEEIRSGYTFKGKVLRHSLVKVAVSPRSDVASTNGGEST
ncbi:MAG: nucleotide exchange factor GrpE [Thaumarchaeota archaeon]|nr:nucleotide exchange factor GrpE [Nitrososphaerota archaeon]